MLRTTKTSLPAWRFKEINLPNSWLKADLPMLSTFSTIKPFINVLRTQHLLQESVENLAARQREFEVNERNFNKDVNNLGEKLSNSEVRNERVSKELNEQRLKVSQLSTSVSSLEQLVCVKDDIKKQLETAERQAAQLLDDRKVLRGQLEAVTITQDQANARLLEAERGNNQLRQIIEEQNTQIEQLTLTIITLRESQEMYLPIKVDFSPQ